jgi:hypothetical protein
MIYNEPRNYNCPAKIKICSNSFENVEYPLVIKGYAPFLLNRKNQQLVAWLATCGSNNSWIELINKNTIRDRRIQLENVFDNLRVSYNSITILRASFIEAEDLISIDELNLIPVGLNIFGTGEYLQVGTHRFTNNSIRDCKIAIKLN